MSTVFNFSRFRSLHFISQLLLVTVFKISNNFVILLVTFIIYFDCQFARV